MMARAPRRRRLSRTDRPGATVPVAAQAVAASRRRCTDGKSTGTAKATFT